MVVLSSRPLQNMTQPNLSEYVRSAYTDTYVSADASDQYTSVDQEDLFRGECHTENCPGAQKKRILFPPPVTVNVFNSAGPSTRESVAGGVGTGGAAAGKDKNAGERDDTIARLECQVAALTQKVEKLSLLAPAQGPVIDSGKWHTNDVRSWENPQVHTKGRINFSKKFKSNPTVMVSMCSADVASQHNFRVKIYATDVERTGFTIHADAWADTKLYSAGASWIAVGK